jgi:hypothetical protein
VCHNIFKFVPEGLLNAEHNSHTLEIYAILGNIHRVNNLSNKVSNSDGSWDGVVGAMNRLLGGGQSNDIPSSFRGKILF